MVAVTCVALMGVHTGGSENATLAFVVVIQPVQHLKGIPLLQKQICSGQATHSVLEPDIETLARPIFHELWIPILLLCLGTTQRQNVLS